MLRAKKTRQKRTTAVTMQALCVAETYVTSKVHRNTLTTLWLFLNYKRAKNRLVFSWRLVLPGNFEESIYIIFLFSFYLTFGLMCK